MELVGWLLVGGALIVLVIIVFLFIDGLIAGRME